MSTARRAEPRARSRRRARAAARRGGRPRPGGCGSASSRLRDQPEPHPEAVAAVAGDRRAARAAGPRGRGGAAAARRRGARREFLTIWFASCAPGRETSSGDRQRRRGFEPDTLVMAALGRAVERPGVVPALERRIATSPRSAASTPLRPPAHPHPGRAPPRIGSLDTAGRP